MRNNRIAITGSAVTYVYKQSGLTVNEFIDQFENAFDIQHLHTVHGDEYASFHVVDGTTVLTVYYWKSRDEWFVKA